MHIEFLVEDQSGEKMLDGLIRKINQDNAFTYNIHAYKGVGGKIPREIRDNPSMARHRILLDNLPRLLSGYGKTFQSYGDNYPAAVIVVCDLDRRNKTAFENELHGLLALCEVQPLARFCLAIEEGEAWFLGDIHAIKQAYPRCKENVWRTYQQDSICGTWEVLADMLYPGGHEELSRKGYQEVGKTKFAWATNITPYMDVDNNRSPSFCHFRDTVREIGQ